MSKTSQSILMLEYLFARDTVSIAELAEHLGTNPRNIPEYKKELEEAGYYIETKTGRYGGYRLNRSTLFPALKLTKEEEEALSTGYDYLLARKDFMQIKEYENAMSKIASSINGKSPEHKDMTVISRYPLAMPEDELQYRYSVLEASMGRKNVVRIKYRSNDNIIRERDIHPYKMYMYNDGWFVLAFCELVKDLRFFKLNRITELKMLDAKFRNVLWYNESDYLDPFGMKNGEWYDVKLKFTGKHAMFTQDYLYGKDQNVECVDSNTTIVSVKMQYKEDIVGFVLSHMEHCEVLEPEWLKEDVKATCNKILKQYK